MRVLVIGRSMPDGRDSSGLFEYQQARALADSGLDVRYCYSDNRSVRINRSIRKHIEWQDKLLVKGIMIPTGGLPTRFFNTIKTNSLNKLLRDCSFDGWEPDVVYAHFPLITLTEGFVETLEQRSIPLVCMEHWTKVLDGDLTADRKRLLQRLVSASAYCCVSEDLKEAVVKLTGISSSAIRVIPNMINDKLFYYEQPIRSKEDLGLPIEFFGCGRLEECKGFSIMLEAFAGVSSGIDCRLVIAGDGSERRNLERLAFHFGVEDKVDFLGWLSSEEVAQNMRKADCFILASSNETFGVPVAEAWMCGVPCIGSSTNPIRSLFPQFDSLLFDTGDSADLSRMMKEMLDALENDRISKMELSLRARSMFSCSQISSVLKSLFKEVVDGSY